MAHVTTSPHRGALDPLKHSQPLGATLVFLGLDRTMPLMHGSQGCASFAKTLSTRHFREPIPLQTTAVTEVTATLGAGPLVVDGLDVLRTKNNPDIIGVMTTGLTEVNGEDFEGELRNYRAQAEPGGPLVVGVSTPDFKGGLTDGWSAALTALMAQIPLDDAESVPEKERPGVAVLIGAGFTVGDVDEITATILGFGLTSVVVPGLAYSIDGHLDEDWSPLTSGGTTLAQLRTLSAAPLIVAIGASAETPAATLADRTGAEVLTLGHVSGLAGTDALIGGLLAHPATDGAPAVVRRDRSRLADGLLDAHFVLGGVRVAVAGEPETLLALTTLLSDVGADVVAAISPTNSPALRDIACAGVTVGDLTDLEEQARDRGAELIIGSSHARAVSDRLGTAFVPAGFPVYDRLGAQLRRTGGYQGSLALLTDIANALLDHHHHTGHHHVPPAPSPQRAEDPTASQHTPTLEKTSC